MEESEELKEAVEKLERISEDERMRRIVDLRDKAICDKKNIYSSGVEDGKEQGIQQEKLEIAKKMLKEKII